MRKSVIGIVFSKDQTQFLAIKRRDVPIWVLPGGGIDPDETPEQAIVREVHEETGLKVAIDRQVAEYTPTTWLTKHTYLFACYPSEGSTHIGTETRDVAFFPVHSPPTPFFPVHADFLADARLNSRTLIRKPTPQTNWLRVLAYALRHPIIALRFALTKIGLTINT
jgi:8-oxo-dGTP pyrophosphatase MutT (NUDIX family)